MGLCVREDERVTVSLHQGADSQSISASPHLGQFGLFPLGFLEPASAALSPTSPPSSPVPRYLPPTLQPRPVRGPVAPHARLLGPERGWEGADLRFWPRPLQPRPVAPPPSSLSPGPDLWSCRPSGPTPGARARLGRGRPPLLAPPPPAPARGPAPLQSQSRTPTCGPVAPQARLRGPERGWGGGGVELRFRARPLDTLVTPPPRPCASGVRSAPRLPAAVFSPGPGDFCSLEQGSPERGRKYRGFLPTENEAFDFILEFLKSDHQDEDMKMTFLSSVTILCSAVKSQEQQNIDDYCNKAMLAERIEMLIIEEPFDVLISSLRQQAMFCIMELSHVNPKFEPSQRMKLMQSGIFSLFSLPANMETDTDREVISLYSQTVRALDEMLQGLMTENENPSMLVFVEILEVIMPWIFSEEIFEKSRALSTLSRQLRFISSFPTLRHMEDFNFGGTLMGILGLFCMDYSHQVSSLASEALHYCFKIFVNQRQTATKSEEERCELLRDLQKVFQVDWTISLEYILLFFRIFLNPEERTNIITLCVEGMIPDSKYSTWAPVEMLEIIISEPLPELSKVSELINTIHYQLSYITDASAIKVIQKMLQELTQKYPDEVMLTLIIIQDSEQDRELWKILAESSKDYEMILNHLLKRLKLLPLQETTEPCQSLEISPLVASRALNELLLESSSKLEVETLYPWLYMALLSLISFLVFEGGIGTIQPQEGMPEWLDPVSSVIESLKTLIQTAGYGYQVSFMQSHGTWELLSNQEGYLEGIFLVAKSMTTRSCWHIRPIVSLILNILSGNEDGSCVTALAVFSELLQSSEVAVMADETTTELLISWLKKHEPLYQQLVLKAVGNFGLHKEMTKHLRTLQPHVLNCCYSTIPSVVTEAFLALRCIINNLTWSDSVILLIEISCALRPFFDDESEELRYNSIDMFAALLAKVKRRFLIVPFRHQVHCSLIPLMFHLQDEIITVAHASRDALCHAAKILVCPRFKSVCVDRDIFTIGRVLLSEQKDKVPWFLSQSLSYFGNSQSNIRRAAVWLTTLKRLNNDPDPTVACLSAQTICLLGVKKIRRSRSQCIADIICFR